MRIIAFITTYNEQAYVAACLEHYYNQGVEVFLLDNESTDSTTDIAREFSNKNLIEIRKVPRKGFKNWKQMLLLKEKLADQLMADWVMHADIDEIRVPHAPDTTLASAVEAIDREGFNAINFMEYTFLPTRESPEHDSKNFLTSMRWYYPFLPRYPHRMNLWKKPAKHWVGLRVRLSDAIKNRRIYLPTANLHSTGGHQVHFPGIKLFPVDFKMRHYMVLSLDHAVSKYVKVRYDPKAPHGYHGWRSTSSAADFQLPSENDLRVFHGDDSLDPTDPMIEHLLRKR